MPDLNAASDAAPAQTTDKVMILRGGTPFVVTIGELLATFQAAVPFAQGQVLARVAAGNGAPAAVPLGQGLAVIGGEVGANAQDHLALATLSTFDANAAFVVNAASQPALLPFAMLADYFLSGALKVAGETMPPVPVAPLLSGSLADNSQTVTGTAWTEVAPTNAARQVVMIQNRGLVQVELSIGGAQPSTPVGQPTLGAFLLDPGEIFPPPGMNFVSTDEMWARCVNAADTSVLTVKLG